MKLPDQEWRFDDLPEAETHLAFLYEYGRESKRIRALVSRARDYQRKIKRKEKVQSLPTEVWEHHLNVVILWLARMPGFPSKPWLALPPTARNADRSPYPLDGPPAVQVIPPPDSEPTLVDDGQPVTMQSAWPAITAGPHECIVKIHWMAPDREILAAIKALRPAEFREEAKAPRGQLSVDGNRFPFRKRAALDWLGVLRRRESVPSWPEYFENYGPKPKEDPKDPKFQVPNEKKDNRGKARARQQDCEQARLILAWFETGAPFDPRDFK